MKKNLLIILYFLLGVTVQTAGAATFTVTNTLDDANEGSLRWAITQANFGSDHDTIDFDIPPGGPQTIFLTQQLPAVKTPVLVDGWSQVGEGIVGVELRANPQMQAVIVFGAGSDTSEIRGLALNNSNKNGIDITHANNISIYGNYIGVGLDGVTAYPNKVQGIYAKYVGWLTIGGPTVDRQNIIVNNGTLSAYIALSHDIVIKGNIIGLDKNGNAPGFMPTTNAGGIFVFADNTDIGGELPEERNVISGHKFGPGISINGDNVKVINNYIGTDISGTQPHGNGIGIQVDGENILIKENVVSANKEVGIYIPEAMLPTTGVPQFDNIVIVSNIIGLSATGDWLGNPETDAQQKDGIYIGESSQITIGESGAGSNTISGNGNGIHLDVQSNEIKIINNNIGLGKDGVGDYPNGRDGILALGDLIWIGGESQDEQNRIANNQLRGIAIGGGANNVFMIGNSIFDNGALGIDLGQNGVTPNDPGDGDNGANHLLNFPKLVAANINGFDLDVTLRLDIDHPSAVVEFFANLLPDPAGHGEGQLFLGRKEISSLSGAEQTVTIPLASSDILSQIKHLSATTTVNGEQCCGTSEFSKTIPVVIWKDYGDLPDPSIGTGPGNYQTTEVDGGAYHIFDENLYLGSCVDWDWGILHNVGASLDDVTVTNPKAGVCAANGDDEDGISFGSVIVAGSSANKMKILNKGSGFLNIWMDFNNDGDFNDIDEVILSSAVSEGTHLFSFIVPEHISGFRYVRARLSPFADMSPIGLLMGGEVEDYRVMIHDPKNREMPNEKWNPAGSFSEGAK